MCDQNKEIMLDKESIKEYLEYSDNPDGLVALLDDLRIYCTFEGIRKHFPDDEAERMVTLITIRRGEKEISFHFGLSIRDTEAWQETRKGPEKSEVINGLLYNVLACIDAEYDCPSLFEDFCAEYGYDEDSRKAFNVWQACLKQSYKLKSIITEEEALHLPF